MKRKEFALSLLGLTLGGTLLARHGHSRGGSRNRGRSRYRGRSRGGSYRRNRKKITDSPITYTGILESKDGKLAISGSAMPIEVDRGMTSLAKKHVGKEVRITGTKITVDGKSKVKVKFIKPVNTTINNG